MNLGPDKVAKLRKLYEEWIKGVGSKGLTPHPDYDPENRLFKAFKESRKKSAG